MKTPVRSLNFGRFFDGRPEEFLAGLRGLIWSVSMLARSVFRRLSDAPAAAGATMRYMLPPGSRLAALSGAWFAACLLAATAARAQSPTPPAKQRGDEFGIVINQTFTQGGQEFYRRFTDFWREKSDFESYTLVIVERPSRRFGNQVLVSFGQRVVFSGSLPVKVDAIRAMSGDAVEKAYANIITLNLRMTGDRDPDVGDEEL